MTGFLYECPNLDVSHQLVRLNIATPTPMRAPGESPGLFALESALDELAYAANVDPVELRLRNYTDIDQESGLPFSGEHLRECYLVGRERSGWLSRIPLPGMMREGRYLIGQGMATATYPGMRMPGAASVRVFADGRVEVSSATQDMGTGTYTTMTQVTAETLGVPVEANCCGTRDSWLPPAPVSGGSMTTASVTPAVKAACEDAMANLIQCAIGDKSSPFYNMPAENMVATIGRLRSLDREIDLAYEDVIRSASRDYVDGKSFVQPGEEQKNFSFHSFGAHL